jgi:hypothetical protein
MIDTISASSDLNSRQISGSPFILQFSAKRVYHYYVENQREWVALMKTVDTPKILRGLTIDKRCNPR